MGLWSLLRIFEKNGARVVLDTTILEMIRGSKIDYVNELIGSKFFVRDNPQVDSRCGCGISFNIK
jgi:iron-sulfur cluster assembly accessory protein